MDQTMHGAVKTVIIVAAAGGIHGIDQSIEALRTVPVRFSGKPLTAPVKRILALTIVIRAFKSMEMRKGIAPNIAVDEDRCPPREKWRVPAPAMLRIPRRTF